MHEPQVGREHDTLYPIVPLTINVGYETAETNLRRHFTKILKAHQKRPEICRPERIATPAALVSENKTKCL